MRRGAQLAAALVVSAALPAVSWAVPEEKVRAGHYSFEKGERTTDGAISFQVKGAGRNKRITNLTYRNSCLTHNAPSPVMRLTRDGRFARTYSHSRNTVMVSVKGRWVSRGRARGRLLINEFGCETRLRFDARRLR